MVCPECGSKNIKDYGMGTEKLEEELNKMFNARVIRMDMDTTSRQGMHEKIINDFAKVYRELPGYRSYYLTVVA